MSRPSCSWIAAWFTDPFKDTAGSSIHMLIKLLATVTLVLAPLFA